MRSFPVLHAVTDDAVLARPGFVAAASAVAAAGGAALALHLRGPGTGGGSVYRLAIAMRSAVLEHGGLLVVNDRVDVALVVEAHGVQLGARSLPAADARRLVGPGVRLGVSVHSVEEAESVDGAADWLLAGAIWPTPSHPGRPGAGTRLLRAMARVRTPVVAIGGVTVDRAGEAREAGAAGVAVLRGIWDAADPAEAVQRYLEAWSRG